MFDVRCGKGHRTNPKPNGTSGMKKSPEKKDADCGRAMQTADIANIEYTQG